MKQLITLAVVAAGLLTGCATSRNCDDCCDSGYGCTTGGYGHAHGGYNDVAPPAVHDGAPAAPVPSGDAPAPDGPPADLPKPVKDEA